MKTQIAMQPRPQFRDCAVTSPPEGGPEFSPPDHFPRDRFHWCYGPNNIDVYGALVAERLDLAAKPSAISPYVGEARTRSGPSDTLFEESFDLEVAREGPGKAGERKVEEYHFDGLPLGG